MTREEEAALRSAKHRAMSLLLSIELFGAEADDPQFAGRTAAKLREIARTCLSMCWHLDQLKERTNGNGIHPDR